MVAGYVSKAVSPDLNAWFQTMEEFHRALEQKKVPEFFSSEIISLEEDAGRLKRLLSTQKWIQPGNFITSHPKIEQNLNLLIHFGTYFLKTQQIEKAQQAYEKALLLMR